MIVQVVLWALVIGFIVWSARSVHNFLDKE